MPDDVEPDADTKPVDVTPEPIDVSVYEAKISELTNQLVEKDAVIEGLNAQITAVKAHNYDMLMAAPGDELPPVIDELGEDTAKDIDDFFEKKD